MYTIQAVPSPIMRMGYTKDKDNPVAIKSATRVAAKPYEDKVRGRVFDNFTIWSCSLGSVIAGLGRGRGVGERGGPPNLPEVRSAPGAAGILMLRININYESNLTN